MTTPDIALTGMGMVSPLAIGAAATWEAIDAGRHGIRQLTALECADAAQAGRLGGEAPCTAAVPIAEDRREVDLLLLALDEAIAQSGLERAADRPAPERMALVLGTTLAGMRRAGAYFRGAGEGVLESFVAGEVSRHVAQRAGIEGLTCAVSAACASGLSSLLHARALLRAGEADVVIAGGYDPITEYAYAGFGCLRLIASGLPKPLQRDRDGMRLGEAFTLFTLERDADARARGATVLAVLSGAGESSDGFHLTRPHPTGDGLARALRDALDDAALSPADLGLLSLHATATPANDAAECAALRSVLAEHTTQIPAVAFKAALGHTLGAAGATEIALSLMAMRAGVAPPTANFNPTNLEFEAFRLRAGRSAPASVSHTLNISLGFGGSNAVAILSRAGASPSPRGEPESPAAPSGVAITGIGYIGDGGAQDASSLARLGLEPEDAGGLAAEIRSLDERAGGRSARRLSLYAKLMLAAAHEAVAASGLSDAQLERAGALLASCHGACEYTVDYYRQLVEEGIDAANPLWFAEGVPNVGSAHVSMALGIRGASQTVIGSRTAGLDAIHLTRARLGSAGWTRVLLGAAEEDSELIERAYRAALRPARGCGCDVRLGRGAGALMLESPADAGDRALAVIERSAARTAPDRSFRAMCDAAAAVTDQLGAVDAVVSSWNGARTGLAELRGIARAQGDAATPVTSFAGLLPELFAAGPIASIGAVVSSQVVPPAPNGMPDLRGRLTLAQTSSPVRTVAFLCSGHDGSVRGVRVALRGRQDGALAGMSQSRRG